MKLQLWKKAGVLTAIVLSGICWFYANDPGGDFGYLLWLAPVGILIISKDLSGKRALLAAFVAYLIGRMSWFSYLVTVATLIPAIIVTVVLPLIFALIIVLTRKVIIRINSWYAVFAFPVLFTAFEWLLITFSSDGTAASIAYSQANYLFINQIVSITGILGITFIVTYLPSALALGIFYRRNSKELKQLVITSTLLIGSVFLFGLFRIHQVYNAEKVKVGLVVLDERIHDQSMRSDIQISGHTAGSYVREIEKLALQGAKLIVFPEKGINISKESEVMVTDLLKQASAQNHVTIVVGYTNAKNGALRNSSLIINSEGIVVADYDKIHLVTGFEDQFTRGSNIALFSFKEIQAGTAICKDLDFPADIRKYGKNETAVLCIPAWDFVVDDWLHSHMAVLRGIENGFSEIRTARLGRLTISDPYGRIVAESNCTDAKAESLLGFVSLKRIDTFYTHYGDWFGWVIIISAIFLIVIIVVKKNKQ